mmetsp:Transcript_13907/g.34291  ORF Transcript_13907/g.34291 Transcript_13907/m.34291 type:complete len:209 (+) Transcript_13907:420-1046(+)
MPPAVRASCAPAAVAATDTVAAAAAAAATTTIATRRRRTLQPLPSLQLHAAVVRRGRRRVRLLLLRVRRLRVRWLLAVRRRRRDGRLLLVVRRRRAGGAGCDDLTSSAPLALANFVDDEHNDSHETEHEHGEAAASNAKELGHIGVGLPVHLKSLELRRLLWGHALPEHSNGGSRHRQRVLREARVERIFAKVALIALREVMVVTRQA